METIGQYGIVSKDGKKVEGSDGWNVRKDGTVGVYSINFLHAFKSTPTVVTTQIYPNMLDSSGGDTRDNAVIVGVSQTDVKIKTGKHDGTGEWRDFSFMAIGDSLESQGE